MKDSKVKGKFTRMVCEGRGKPKLVVNVEVSKNGDLHKRIVRMCSTLEVR